MAVSPPEPRSAARVLVLDEGDRVLLFRGWDPAEPQAGSWWITPGGGLEPGETPRDAAGRELREETGLSTTDLHGPVHTDEVEYSLEGHAYRQRQEYFYTRVTRFELSNTDWTPLERDIMLDSRWWSIEELEQNGTERAPAEPVYPRDLAAVIQRSLGER